MTRVSKWQEIFVKQGSRNPCKNFSDTNKSWVTVILQLLYQDFFSNNNNYSFSIFFKKLVDATDLKSFQMVDDNVNETVNHFLFATT